jgi:Zn-finger nucleic acid-binding protein
LNEEERRRRSAAASHRGPAPERARGFRKCPQCAGLMIRRNLGRGASGIIVDVCGEHGLWFDDDELARVIAWMRTGGLEAAREDVARLKSSPDVQRKRRARSADGRRQPGDSSKADSFGPRPRGKIGRELEIVAKMVAAVLGWTIGPRLRP